MSKSVIRVHNNRDLRRLQNSLGVQFIKISEENIPEGWSDPYCCPFSYNGACAGVKNPNYQNLCFGGEKDFRWNDCDILKMDLRYGESGAFSDGSYIEVLPVKKTSEEYEAENYDKHRLSDDSLQDLIDDDKMDLESVIDFGKNLRKNSIVQF